VVAAGAPSLSSPRLVRARLTPGKHTVQLERLSDTSLEFPQIAHGRCHAKRHRFVWGTELLSDPELSIRSQIVKVDVERGDSRRYTDRECTYGEPVFVPRPGASAEDDGVLLTVGSFPREERSRLLVLDAQSLEPLARCETDVSIPFGFHGTFAQAEPSSP
jgi:carotenoid cleavage dioxygenase-like enzyme